MFLRLKNVPKIFKTGDIIYNYDFALKDVNYESNKTFFEDKKDDLDKTIEYQSEDFDWNDKKIKFSNYNLIYGNNDIGKNWLINSYADYKKIQYFNWIESLLMMNIYVIILQD